MSGTNPDPIAAILEYQLALLTPIAAHLGAAAGAAPLVHDDEWRGPAARSFRDREAELSVALRHAAAVLEHTLRRLRLAIAGLP